MHLQYKRLLASHINISFCYNNTNILYWSWTFSYLNLYFLVSSFYFMVGRSDFSVHCISTSSKSTTFPTERKLQMIYITSQHLNLPHVSRKCLKLKILNSFIFNFDSQYLYFCSLVPVSGLSLRKTIVMSPNKTIRQLRSKFKNLLLLFFFNVNSSF